MFPGLSCYQWHEVTHCEGKLILSLSLALSLAAIWGCRKIHAQKTQGKSSSSGQIPSLLDATADQLLTGLEREWFTSSDLVNVSQIWDFVR